MQVLAKFGFSYAAFLLVASLLGAGTLVWCFPALLLLLGAGVTFKTLRGNRTFWCIASAAVLALSSFFLYTQFVYRPAVRLNNVTAELRAKVEDVSRQTSGYRYELTALQVDGADCPAFGVTLYSQEDLFATYGDGLTAIVDFSETEAAEGAALGDYYKSHGIFLTAELTDGSARINPGAYYSVNDAFRSFRDSLIASLERSMPEASAKVAAGMLLGGTTNLEEADRVTFSRAGISHLFSVSGLHLTIVIQFFLVFLSLCRVPKRAATIAGLCAAFGFVALAGFTASVMRSGIMLAILMLGELFRRRSNGLNSLGLACLFITFSDPYSMYDVGFLLSVSATLGILLFARRIQDRISGFLRIQSRSGREIVSLFAVSLAATAGTIPVSLLTFQEVSVVGLLVNPVINLFVSLVMFAGFATAFLGLVPLFEPLAAVSGAVCNWAVTAISRGAELAVELPFAYLPIGYGFVKSWLVLTAVIIGLCVLFRRRRKHLWKIAVPVSLVLLVLPAGFNLYAEKHSVIVTAIRSDSASGVLIRAGDVNIVYGAGDSRTGTALRRELMSKGVREIDLYIQSGRTNGDSRITAQYASILPVRNLAVHSDVILRGALPDVLAAEQILPLGDIAFDYPDGSSIRVLGEMDPVLEFRRDGRVYLVALDLESTLVLEGREAPALAAARTTACETGDSSAGQILLLADTGQVKRPDPRVVREPAFRTELWFPDWETE